MGYTVLRCEGNSTSDYLSIHRWTRNEVCFAGSDVSEEPLLIREGKDIVHMKILSERLELLPSGKYTLLNIQLNYLINFLMIVGSGYRQYESFKIGISGEFKGKYIYTRAVRELLYNLKKCSSILGKSYVNTIHFDIYVSDYMDPRVLIEPTGALNAFKRIASTVCRKSGLGFAL